jgi:1-acyl-sn-glycerol-3-phosphate acyltransferase
MALEGRVKVLPVAMIGTDKAQPTGKKVPKLMRIGIKIGTPLDFSRYEGMEDDRFVLRSITDEIMYELMLLSGQEYVDMYATSMKDRILAAAKTKAREIQEAALPGTAAKELEEALDAGDDEAERRQRPTIDDATADIGEPDDDAVDGAVDPGAAPPGRRAAS